MKDAVKDYDYTKEMTVNELVNQMENAWGFTAGKLATGVKIMECMIEAKDCVKFLSFTGNLVATGTRGVLRELVRRKLVDVVITTCGTIDHDMARCWKDYYRGSFVMNDSKLHEEGVNRLGNVLVPNDSYGSVIEKKVQTLLLVLYKEGKREMSASQFVREIGFSRGHFPVPVPTGEVLLMEVQIASIAGIPMFAAPDLEAGGLVPGKECHRGFPLDT